MNKKINITVNKKPGNKSHHVTMIKGCGTGASQRARIEKVYIEDGILYLERDDGTILSVELDIQGGGTFDGVYNPDVPLSTEMVYDLGGLLAGTTAGSLDGLTFSELFDLLLFTAEPPVYNSPTSSLSSNVSNTILEVDQQLVATFTATFNQNNGGNVTSFSAKRNGTEIATINPFDETITLSDVGSRNYQGTFNYEEGPILNDSQENPFPLGQVPAGSTDTNIITYNWVYPVFYGITQTPGNIDILNDFNQKVLSTNYNNIVLNFNSTSSDYLWFAAPASAPIYTSWFVTALNQGAIGGGSNLFNDPTLISAGVVFANSAYNLYISNYSSELLLTMTIS